LYPILARPAAKDAVSPRCPRLGLPTVPTNIERQNHALSSSAGGRKSPGRARSQVGPDYR